MPVSMQQPGLRLPSASVAVVLGALYARPEDDTPQAIARMVGDAALDPAEVARALVELRTAGLAQSERGHWQLTAAAFRERQVAPVAPALS